LVPVISEGAIASRLEALACRIDEDYAGRALDVVCALNGASVFCADLVRRLSVPVTVHPLGFASYDKPRPSGEVRLTLDVDQPLHGRDVLLVEGIIVSGRTPRYVADMLRLRQPASLSVCALGVKRQQLAVDLPMPYVAFDLGPEVLVGFGVGEGPEKALPYLAERRDEATQRVAP
jgi:hypoxanthine phosphoribosyltransferase